MKLSVVIPAYNERENIVPTVEGLCAVLRREAVPFEIVVVNDNSKDDTREVVLQLMEACPEVVLVDNTPPGGFGRAIRTGLQQFAGDVVAIVMADGSDDPEDVVRCYRKLDGGYDCVFGSRFRRDSDVVDYPPVKLFVNRVVNKLMQLMFLTPFNDLTNAFKLYRRSVIEGIGELESCHFNITIELSLSCVIRRYRIAEVPIRWYGRKWGASNLKLREMGRRYLATLLKLWFERLLIADDMMLETEGRVVARPPARRIEHGSRDEPAPAAADRHV
jgi:dolichol-phosphate mannosyltransferase